MVTTLRVLENQAIETHYYSPINLRITTTTKATRQVQDEQGGARRQLQDEQGGARTTRQVQT